MSKIHPHYRDNQLGKGDLTATLYEAIINAQYTEDNGEITAPRRRRID